MTRIEAETTIAAAPAAVWMALLDEQRWAAWSPLMDATGKRRRVTLDGIEPLDGPADQVGALRYATATVAVPLLGRRAARWVEQVADVAAPWTIEYEALARRPIKRWRLRLRLIEQGSGTRIRCRLTYTPTTLGLKLANVLFLHRAIADQAQATLDGLARSFQAAPEPQPTDEPTDEPVEETGAVIAA